MNKDRKYCSNKGCLTRTCSRHRCQLPKWYNDPIEWKDYYWEEDCPYYQGMDRIRYNNDKKAFDESSIGDDADDE